MRSGSEPLFAPLIRLVCRSHPGMARSRYTNKRPVSRRLPAGQRDREYRDWSLQRPLQHRHAGASSTHQATIDSRALLCLQRCRFRGDSSPKGATEYFPRARIVFDKFHVVVLAGRALDKVRYELQREGANLKGAMWSLRGNTWNLSEDRQEERKNLCRQYTKLGRAMSLRETLQAIYATSDRQVAEAELRWWCDWAARSRLSPFRDLAKTVSGQP